MSAEVNQNQNKPSGLLANLLFNIIIPALIMTKLADESLLGPSLSIVVALAFPAGYGLLEFKRSEKINPISVLGFVSVLLTGTISLLELPAEYIAIKEALIPGIIGIAVLVAQQYKHPVLKVLLLNEQVFNWKLADELLAKKNNQDAFEKLLAVCSYVIAASFFFSSALNYILAKVILVSPPGTQAFTEELGKMTALSYPVIAIPSMLILFGALVYFFTQLNKLTGKSIEDFM